MPRQVAMYLTRILTDTSLPAIGKAFGGKDHSTVLHACKKIEEKLARDQGVRAAARGDLAARPAGPRARERAPDRKRPRFSLHRPRSGQNHRCAWVSRCACWAGAAACAWSSSSRATRRSAR